MLCQAFLLSEGFSKEQDHIAEMIQVLDLQGTDKVTFKKQRQLSRQTGRQTDNYSER